MGTTGFLTCRSGIDSLNGVLKNVAEFERLDEVTGYSGQCGAVEEIEHYSRVPDHAPVLDANLVITLEDFAQLLHAFIQTLLSSVKRRELVLLP